jgi:hypothetical protein
LKSEEVKAMMIVTALLTSVMMLASGAPRVALSTTTPQRRDFTERDEINQTYQLPAGARVEVSSIRGPVEIVNSETGNAEIHIIRSARTRADLEHHKIEVKQDGNGLVVRGVQEPEDRRGQNIQVDHHVMLKLPRRIDLSISSISGWIKVGDVDGETRINSISGSAKIGNVSGKLQVSSISGSLNIANVDADVRVNSVSGSLELGNVGGEARVSGISGNVGLGQVNGSLEVLSVSGGLKATLLSLSPQGIHITSVSGSIEINFKSDVNADFTANSISGEVYLDVPNVIRESEEKSPNVRARIGGGGAPISISSVSGNIRLTRS